MHPLAFAILTLHFVQYLIGGELKNQYGLSVGLQQWPCDNRYPIIPYQGTTIFQNTGPSATINDFTITGWYIFRGYFSIDHNIISVNEGTSKIYEVYYNFPANVIKIALFTNPIQAFNLGTILTKDKWYFIKIRLEFDTGSGKIYFNMLILDTKDSNYYKEIPITENLLHLTSFVKNNLIFNFSNPIPGLPQSCSITKNIYIYWDTVLDNTDLFDIKNDVINFDSYLLWNFDLFYTEQNIGYLINTEFPNQKQYIAIQNEGPLFLRGNGQEFFFTDYINALEQGGFMVSFHLRLDATPPNGMIFYILALQFIPTVMQIFINNGSLYLSSGTLLNNIGSFSSTQWNQIVLIVKLRIKTKAFLIVNNQPPIQISNFDWFQLTALQFGNSSITGIQIYLSNIRVYMGTFLSEDVLNCKYQIERYQKSCILCKNGYLMDYQGNLKCVSSSPVNQSTLINNVKDWYPKQFQCHPDMILDKVTNNCICRFQYYREGDKCQKCKDYCKGCTDANTCIEKDKFRDSDGVCQPNYFDDGYSCLQQQYAILSQQNYKWNLQYPDTGPNCLPITPILFSHPDYILGNSNMQLQQNTPFLISFSFQAHLPYQSSSTIATFKDVTYELFTVIYKDGINHSLVFLFQGNVKGEFTINKNEAAWIGFWTDFSSTAIFFVLTNTEFNYQEQPLDFSFYTFNDPELCVGKCFSNFQATWNCGSYSNTNINIIKNMLYPIDKSKLLYLFSEKFQLLAHYTLNFQFLLHQNEIDNFVSSSVSSKLIFNSDITFERQKGILLTSAKYGKITSFNFGLYFPTFSCSLFIKYITYQVQIISYELAPIKVQYFIVPYGEKAFIRICAFEQCIDTKYAMLNLNQYNTLFILSRNRSPFSLDILVAHFEVVCNYQIENIYFFEQVPVLSGVDKDIFIGNSQEVVGDHHIYINNIKIEQGSGSYYIDYLTAGQNCFLLKNIYAMECLLPKRNYLFYQNQLITEAECNNLTNIQSTLFVIDQSTKQCIDTKLSNTCIEIDEQSQTLKCKKCKYLNADPDNGCQCLDSTYLDFSQQACLPCSDYCITCENSFDNCIICKHSDQKPPSCECEDSNYYLDISHTCKQCSFQCQTCVSDSYNCLTCSENRVNPPFCNCASYYTEDNLICKPIECKKICEICEVDSSDCVNCKFGRVNPPTCECDINYYPTSDGQCLPCPASTFYDLNTLSCQSCQRPCTSCEGSKDNCTSCENGLEVKDFECKCENGSIYQQIANNKFICAQVMDVTLQIKLKQNYYYLEFTFDYPIQSINFSYYNSDISSLITVQFSEISSNYYYLSDPIILENKLFLKLNVNQSFKTLNGQVLFIKSTPFISISEVYVLKQLYTTNPISFSIGPFIFDEDTLTQVTDRAIETLKNKDFFYQYFIQESQFLLYFVNTAQPTLLFLLLKAQLPPNLYKFYQVFGLMIFPDVVNYQTTDYKSSYNLFRIDLNNTEVYICSSNIYQKLGFSNSFFVNNPVMILKYILFVVLILTVYIISQNHSRVQAKLQNALFFLLKKIQSENETNLLIGTIAIFVQFTENDQSSWANRYGYYFSLCFLIFFIVCFYYNFKKINSDKKLTKNEFSYTFTERLIHQKSFLQKNYFLFQMMKKYLVLISLFLLQNYPYYACTLNGVIFLLSAVHTILSQPYKIIFSRVIKIIGEFILSLTWFLHLVLLIMENKLYKQTVLEADSVNKYINLGNIVIITLLIFNFLFIIELLFEGYLAIKQFFNKKIKAKKQPPLLIPYFKNPLKIQEKNEFSWNNRQSLKSYQNRMMRLFNMKKKTYLKKMQQ